MVPNILVLLLQMGTNDYICGSMEFGVYRELVRAARPLFEAEDWSRLKGLLREGIAKGAYAQDSHGIDTLDRCIRTGTVIVEKTGLKKASLLTALFDPMVQKGLIAPEDFRKQFGEDAAGLIQVLRIYPYPEVFQTSSIQSQE